ncbi:MAG: VOC family protein [Ferruginibacter sp.]
MISINPYIHFNGNAEDAMNFYKSVFGGEFTIFQRSGDVPGSEKISAGEKEKMIHVSLVIGNGITIMAIDSLKSVEQDSTFSNKFNIYMNAETEAETNKIFALLSAGGKVKIPLKKHSGVPGLECARINLAFTA